uniref:Uncharacterized protein n=1 Tax=Helianthus annuus TaxID=4232 RepID=A0A1Y3BZX3_HELAN
MKVVVQQRQPWFECVISPGCRLSTGVRVTGGTGNDTAVSSWKRHHEVVISSLCTRQFSTWSATCDKQRRPVTTEGDPAMIDEKR